MKKALFGEFIAVMISAMLWQKAYNCRDTTIPMVIERKWIPLFGAAWLKQGYSILSKFAWFHKVIAWFVYQIDQAFFLLLGLKQGKIMKNQRKPASEWSMRLLRGRFFCVFGVKKLRTFYFKLTEQSSRKKLAEGGFEPEKVRLLSPAPLKKH